MAGIVEAERDGKIHRARYWVDGTVVVVSYGAKVKQCGSREGEDSYAVARRLLREIVAELHDNIQDKAPP
jgi:hypothetical protein